MSTDASVDRPLPPGFTARRLDAALDDLERALGPDAVVRAEADLDEYRDQMAHPRWRHRRPSAAVLPTSVEEVQAALKIANEHRLPLWPHSTGRNNGYG